MWNHKNTFAVGGLENVGFAADSDHLIVLSSQGRGIFDCIKGEKIARDSFDWWPQFDESTSTVKGFDVLEGAAIQTSGLYGDNALALATADGWRIMTKEDEFDDPPFEKYPVTKLFLVSPDSEQFIFISKDGACELRSFGFSPTGNSLVVALSCDLTIWSRGDLLHLSQR